tara:strand:- start:162361 stop:164715 length:2355 start_codon:yes stop_codon:yes gene_type:complete
MSFSSVIAAAAAGTITKLVNTNNITDVWTPEAKRATGKGTGGAAFSPEGVMKDWGGAVYIPSLNAMFFSSGGHSGYMGNEGYLYYFDTLTWARGYLPSQNTDETTFIHSAFTASTTPATFTPPSSHTYGTLEYLTDFNKIFYYGGLDFYAEPSQRFGGVDFTGAKTLTGPWLIDPTKFDADKVGGDTGTGRDISDIGANVFENRDWLTNSIVKANARITCAYENKVWAADIAGNIYEHTISADGLTDTSTVLFSGAGTNVRNMVYVPHLNILVIASTGGVVDLAWYDLNFAPDNFQVIKFDTTVTGWVDSLTGMAYDASRKTIVMHSGTTDVWEVGVPDSLTPANFTMRSYTTANDPVGIAVNGVNSRFRMIEDGAYALAGKGGVGEVWALKAPVDTPHTPIKAKSDITTSTTLKTLTTPIVLALPLIESSGTTVREFVSGTDITIAGSLTTFGGISVMDGGLVLPIDIGDLTNGATVIVGFFQDENDTGSQWDNQYLLENTAGTIELGMNVFTELMNGTFANQRNWPAKVETGMASYAFLLGGGEGSKVSINGGDVQTRTDTIAGFPLGNNAKLFDSIDKAAYMFILDGRVTDAEAQAISLDPFNTLMENPAGPVNTVPVADAGEDQSVAAGATVTLDGTGSTDADLETLTYLWTQTAGDTVTLDDDTLAEPEFTAPSTDTEQTLTFSLVVNDGTEDSDPDTVDIVVAALSSTLTITATGTPDGDYTVDFLDPTTREILSTQTITFTDDSGISAALPYAVGTTLRWSCWVGDTYIFGAKGVTA